MPKAWLPTPGHFRLSGRCVEGDPAAANGGAKASPPGTLLSAASIIFNLHWPKCWNPETLNKHGLGLQESDSGLEEPVGTPSFPSPIDAPKSTKGV